MDQEIQENTVTYTKKSNPFNMRKIVAWIVLAVVIIVVIILIVAIVNTIKRNKTKRVNNQPIVQEEKKKEEKKGLIVVPKKEEESKPESKPLVDIEMSAFIEEYKKDIDAANSKYVGKEIETYGYIQNMATSFTDGSPFISIVPVKKGVYTEERIKCLLNDETVFEGLKSGEGVAVKGTVQSFEFGFIPFKNCTVRK